LVEKVEDKYVHNIATAERTGGTIEPQIMDQWFVAVNRPFEIKHSKINGIQAGDRATLKQIMYNAVNEGQIKIIPEHYNKTYFHWIENLNDWCISRQIWYGHRIPVWYKKDPANPSGKPREVYCDIISPSEAGRPDADEFVQDEDTLDTWFSSGLWTFSTLGWPKAYNDVTGEAVAGSDLARFHPTNLLVTGPDILFFWVARMVLMTGYGIGDIPFPTVYMNGLVRDVKGLKMSKSLGNGGDVIEICNKYGADALRMFYAMSTAPGTDSRLDENKIKGFKHFGNKLWNIARFILSSTEGIEYAPGFSAWSTKDTDLIAERDEMFKTVTEEIAGYKYHLASEKIYQYVWGRFADVILEESKIIFNRRVANVEKGIEAADAGTAEEKVSRAQFLLNTLRQIIVVIHPFMPHVTEELWSIITTGKGITEKEAGDITATDLLMAHPWPVK
jgi:valyl-tRNA synthetase